VYAHDHHSVKTSLTSSMFVWAQVLVDANSLEAGCALMTINQSRPPIPLQCLYGLRCLWMQTAWRLGVPS